MLKWYITLNTVSLLTFCLLSNVPVCVYVDSNCCFDSQILDDILETCALLFVELWFWGISETWSESKMYIKQLWKNPVIITSLHSNSLQRILSILNLNKISFKSPILSTECYTSTNLWKTLTMFIYDRFFFSFPFSLLSRHAFTAPSSRHFRRTGHQYRHGNPILVSLHACCLRLAGGCTSNSM